MFWRENIDINHEPFKVLLKRGEFVDETRAKESGGRTIPFKLYYPADRAEKFPVILWSHGYGGNRDGAGFISRYVASHGYIIMHITHPGSDSSLWEGKAVVCLPVHDSFIVQEEHQGLLRRTMAESTPNSSLFTSSSAAIMSECSLYSCCNPAALMLQF